MKTSVLTEEEGTMSGELDVTVDDTGKGLVRYRETEDWFTIGNFDAEPPRTWGSVAELAAAVEAAAGTKDAAGNTVPFEAPPASAADTASEPPTSAPSPGASTTGRTEAQPGVAAPPDGPAGDAPESTTPTTDGGAPSPNTAPGGEAPPPPSPAT
ncbi:hypothetical protein ACWEKT_36295 [Nocardia takedensis]